MLLYVQCQIHPSKLEKGVTGVYPSNKVDHLELQAALDILQAGGQTIV